MFFNRGRKRRNPTPSGSVTWKSQIFLYILFFFSFLLVEKRDFGWVCNVTVRFFFVFFVICSCTLICFAGTAARAGRKRQLWRCPCFVFLFLPIHFFVLVFYFMRKIPGEMFGVFEENGEQKKKRLETPRKTTRAGFRNSFFYVYCGFACCWVECGCFFLCQCTNEPGGWKTVRRFFCCFLDEKNEQDEKKREGERNADRCM